MTLMVAIMDAAVPYDASGLVTSLFVTARQDNARKRHVTTITAKFCFANMQVGTGIEPDPGPMDLARKRTEIFQGFSFFFDISR